MRSSKGSRRIVVEGHEYRWKAKGDDGYISVGIWPTSNIGGYIHGTLPYHQTILDMGNGRWSSARDQIVVTSRLIRRVICHAVAAHDYDPNKKSPELRLGRLDRVIEWDDAIRAPFRDPGPQVAEVPQSEAHAPSLKYCPETSARGIPVHTASFTVQTASFPGGVWIELRKALRSIRSARGCWQRIDGSGFTLWLSDVRLADSRSQPPTWEIRLESLAPLNPAGQQRWSEACEAIAQFLEQIGPIETLNRERSELPLSK